MVYTEYAKVNPPIVSCCTDPTDRTGNRKGSSKISRSMGEAFCTMYWEMQGESLRTLQNQHDGGHHIRKGPLCRNVHGAEAGNAELGHRDWGLGSNQDAITQPLCAKAFNNWPRRREPDCNGPVYDLSFFFSVSKLMSCIEDTLLAWVQDSVIHLLVTVINFQASVLFTEKHSN